LELDMRTLITATALLVFLVLGAPSRAQPLPKHPDPDMMKRVIEQARLQGEWLPKYLLTKDGIEPYPLKGRGLDFTDNTFVQTEGRRRVQAGTFRLEPSSRGLDLIVEQHDYWDVDATPQKPKVPHTRKCGYRVTGDLLTVCYTAGKDRPDDLKPGVGRTVVVYERVK
jgi:uncharacterized protein (TIGR03067 family)